MCGLGSRGPLRRDLVASSHGHIAEHRPVAGERQCRVRHKAAPSAHKRPARRGVELAVLAREVTVLVRRRRLSWG